MTPTKDAPDQTLPPADVAPLVDESAAIVHLRLGTPLSPELQSDLTAKLTQATNAIVDYLKPINVDPTWTTTTTPAIVQMAILLCLTNLWEHRGDDGAPTDADAACWNAIERLLRRRRDPALA